MEGDKTESSFVCEDNGMGRLPTKVMEYLIIWLQWLLCKMQAYFFVSCIQIYVKKAREVTLQPVHEMICT